MTAAVHDGVNRPKLGTDDLVLFRRGLEVPEVPRSQDPASVSGKFRRK